MLGIVRRIKPNILMAVFAGNGIRVIVPVNGELAGAVQFQAVTFRAEHVILGPVHIGWVALVFPEILGADARAMAGYTGVLHGG